VLRFRSPGHRPTETRVAPGTRCLQTLPRHKSYSPPGSPGRAAGKMALRRWCRRPECSAKAPRKPASGPVPAWAWPRGRQPLGNRSDVDRIHIGPVAPGRRGQLPARAPLRTVLESFPSYGSSPHKARHILWPTRGLTRDKSRSDNLAILTGSRFTLCSFEATAPGRINRLASVVICFLGIGRFHWLSCHFRPDRRGRIQRITAGLGFFGLPKAAPPDPPCGEVCRVARPGGVGSVSMFCKVHRMI
jgi:hypothetical protein